MAEVVKNYSFDSQIQNRDQIFDLELSMMSSQSKKMAGVS